MKVFTTINQAYGTLSYILRNSLSWISTLDLAAIDHRLEEGDRTGVANMIHSSLRNVCSGQKLDLIVKAVCVNPIVTESWVRGNRVTKEITLLVKARFDLAVSSNVEGGQARTLIITDQFQYKLADGGNIVRLMNAATYKDVIQKKAGDSTSKLRSALLMDMYRHQIAYLFSEDKIAESKVNFEKTDPLVGTAIYHLTIAGNKLCDEHNIRAVFFKDVKAVRVDDHVMIDAVMEYKVGQYNATYALNVHLIYSPFEMSF